MNCPYLPDVEDGAPAARFAQRLKALVEGVE